MTNKNIKLIEKACQKIIDKTITEIEELFEKYDRKRTWRTACINHVKMHGQSAFDNLLKYDKGPIKRPAILHLIGLVKHCFADPIVYARFCNNYTVWRYGLWLNENNFQEEIADYKKRKTINLDGSTQYLKNGESKQSTLFECINQEEIES